MTLTVYARATEIDFTDSLRLDSYAGYGMYSTYQIWAGEKTFPVQDINSPGYFVFSPGEEIFSIPQNIGPHIGSTLST